MENSAANQRPTLLPIGIAYLVILLTEITTWLFYMNWTVLPKTFGVTRNDALNVLTWVSIFGFIAGKLLAGALLTRFRIGVLLLFSSLIIAAAFIVQALSPSWDVVLLFEFIGGVGSALMFTLIIVYLMTRGHPRWLIWSYAFINTASLPLFIADMDWRSSCFVAAALAIVTAFLFAVSWQQWHIPTAQSKSQPSMPRPFGISWLWLTLIIFIVLGSLSSIPSTFWSSLLITANGISSATRSTWDWILRILPIVIPVFLGILSDRIKLPRLIWICISVTVVGIALTAVRSPGDINFLGVGLAISLLSALNPILTFSVNRNFPLEQLPSIIGVQGAVFTLGTSVIYALLNDTFSVELSLMTAFAAVIIVAIAVGLNQQLNKSINEPVPSNIDS